MNDLLSLLGVSVCILSLCFGISGCRYLDAKADTIRLQNELARKQIKTETAP